MSMLVVIVIASATPSVCWCVVCLMRDRHRSQSYDKSTELLKACGDAQERISVARSMAELAKSLFAEPPPPIPARLPRHSKNRG
jgi:hypothetical protein